jgi:error-prone DNA polymerase
MIAAGFTAGEAEELRRAFGFKRSEARMREVEVKLRRGMDARGIVGDVQEKIVHAITSFALYGFPESHAASFALLAYASAYLKTRYLAAFTAAMLNNQPMGFYGPATIVKDAQRHGLRVRPVDVTQSSWLCTVVDEDGRKCLRMGLLYAKGLREEIGRALVAARDRRPFRGIEDLARRVPGLRKAELRLLAEIGALNEIVSGRERHGHRRDALWMSERAARPSGELFGEAAGSGPGPLRSMSATERLEADLSGTGVTLGPHPIAQRRPDLDRRRVARASELHRLSKGRTVRVAGAVIVRQRPGTAKGFFFMSLEDETGIANVIVRPALFEEARVVLVSAPFLLVEGVLQYESGVVSIRASRVEAVDAPATALPARDFR